MILFFAALFVVLGSAAWLLMRRGRRVGLHRWLLPYIATSWRRRNPRADEEIHVFLCIADHFEPNWGKAPPELAAKRVQNWVCEYPRLFASFRDSDGRPPRHTFFYPQEEYDPELIDALAGLCRAGFGEIEVHLHHDQDTDAGLRSKLLSFKKVLAERHGLLSTPSRGRAGAETKYAFIHGNWALCNGRPDGRFCGVNNELKILRETGCYADFTFPSAPDPSQPGKLNSIYYAHSRPDRPAGHRWGVNVRAGRATEAGLMLIQGPLLIHSRKETWLPGLENGCLQESQPPTALRLERWLKARVQVPGRPDWFFVKLYAHGAQESSQRVLLGEPMQRFHEELARKAAANPNLHYHYVTAREMYNLVKAAEAGWSGSVFDALDYELTWNSDRRADGVSRRLQTEAV